ncbi:Fructose-1,6-bisphosphatase, cytosolic [Hordeum vulgare]|nr:Fructose-1,6-bisphosphatase, cytosolic [Hordeum vulgare]
MALGPGRVGAAALAEARSRSGTLDVVLPDGRRMGGRPPQRAPLPLTVAPPPPLAHCAVPSSPPPRAPGCSTRREWLPVGPTKKQKQSRRTAAGVVRHRLALVGVGAPHPPTYNQPAAAIPKMIKNQDTGTMEEVLQPGKDMLAAGYCMYGRSWTPVPNTGNGVNGFTLDPSLGQFIMTHPGIEFWPGRPDLHCLHHSYFQLDRIYAGMLLKLCPVVAN